MTESLEGNTTEHEALKPRTRVEWRHDPFFCDICWPDEFRRMRAGKVWYDLFMRGVQCDVEKLRALSIKEDE